MEREKEEAIAKMKRDQQAEIDRLKRQQEEILRKTNMEEARKLHEKELQDAKLREEKERKKALRLKEMKNTPVIKRTKELLNEINNNICNLSEAETKWDQYEEIINNIKSLKTKLEKAEKDLTINMGNEKQRRESVKSKLTNDLKDAEKRFKQAKTEANVSGLSLCLFLNMLNAGVYNGFRSSPQII